MPTLRILSWNVLADAYARPGWFPQAPPDLLAPGARTELIAAAVHRLVPDVVLLQEAEENLTGAFEGRFGAFWDRRPHGKRDGLLTLVDLERTGSLLGRAVADVTPRRIDFTDGTDRLAQVLTLKVENRYDITIANAHLEFTDDGSQAADQMTNLLRHLSDRAVVAGDLNTFPGGPARNVASAAGFVGAQDDEPTSLFNGHEMRALDVIAGRGVTVRRRALLDPRDAGPTRACPSDHVPLLAEVSVP